ncbi:methionyl-tRNA formyltransferase, partial [Falsirhodobacter sp. alg1]|uniref:methionyl-tRNA formyltransferase n=1 Tax=Falsirhodobacter sp. alg1 TaxID=1472418 RepID=UPI0023B95743
MSERLAAAGYFCGLIGRNHLAPVNGWRTEARRDDDGYRLWEWGSLLPRWRGAAPIHRAILAGDAETGICIMQMEAGLDTGPVILREALPIGPTDTTADLHDRLAAMGARMIGQAIAAPQTPVTQSDADVTYAAKIDKSEARIDWT